MSKETDLSVLPSWRELLPVFWGTDSAGPADHPLTQMARNLDQLHCNSKTDSGKRHARLIAEVDEWVSTHAPAAVGVGTVLSDITKAGVRVRHLLEATCPHSDIDLTRLARSWDNLAYMVENAREDEQPTRRDRRLALTAAPLAS
ncbi:hypothetical protein [Nocardia sp. XZ_19_369]|uniref:hypothetical protein n=1 Tax=Nocardia sp. XZ_19_369 TaxID=2769487 RepID=UPI00188E4125|nr:hypothetical protein [Nocardia sp. XZ_19_369]